MQVKVSIIVPVYNVENHIEDMLISVQNQSFRDFEVIIVNDGSTDTSQQIAEKICKKDLRFKTIYQENAGVAKARNAGLKLAKGEYVVFYDPDDFIPQNALKKMYKTASKRRADIVVGVMEEINLGQRTIYMHSQKLAKQKYICPTNQYFFGAWSLCNKMFSIKFIREKSLEMESIRHSEDGVYTFCALNKAEVVCGCNSIAYNYLKRPFWLNPSATQIISEEYLEHLLKAHERILEEVNALADKFNVEDKNKYMEKIYVRLIGDIISGYYRNSWRAEKSFIVTVEKELQKYRPYISDESWEEILKANKDICLEEGIKPLEEVIKEPILSVFISDNIRAEALKLVLGSLYNQIMPNFEIIISQKLMDEVTDEYSGKTNIRIEKEAKGKYVIFVQEPVIFTKHSLKKMVDRLEENKGLDFVTMLVKRFDGIDYSHIKSMIASYGYFKRVISKPNKLTFLDTMISNKMMRKESLENKIAIDQIPENLDNLYRNLKFEKLKKGMILTSLSEEEIISKAKTKPSRVNVFIHYEKNKIIGSIIERLKRHLTREDINKIRKKVGKAK